MTYAVILAGGVGSRFWPQSRNARPKQFLNVFGADTLLQNTLARMQGLVPPERCLVVTNRAYVDDTRRQVPALPDDRILAEPVGRNTAPAIAFAAQKLVTIDPEAVMIVLPADHFIRDVARFHKILRVAVAKARDDGAVVTIGITPTHAATGYGYIEFDPSTGSLRQGSGQAGGAPEARTAPDALEALPVRAFEEKPEEEVARRYVDSGRYLWNSGMFIWKARTALEEIRRHLPGLHDAFAPLAGAFGTPDEDRAVEAAFARAPSISIDYGVMEKAERVFVVPGAFGWSDVGDWRAVYDLSPKDDRGNAARGDAVLHEADGCYVDAGSRLVALVGVRGLAVVDTGDALLVCDLEHTQLVKDLRTRLAEAHPEHV